MFFLEELKEAVAWEANRGYASGTGLLPEIISEYDKLFVTRLKVNILKMTERSEYHMINPLRKAIACITFVIVNSMFLLSLHKIAHIYEWLNDSLY